MGTTVRATKPPQPVATPAGLPLRVFTVDEYHAMINAGVFDGGRRCVLIHGMILEKPLPGPPHSTATQRLNRRLSSLFPETQWVVGIQDSITLADSEPEPDCYVAVGPDSLYHDRHPGPKDLVLVVEVSDSSLSVDRGTMLALYASQKIVQYWIVNVNDRRVEVYTQPRGGKNPTYKQQTNYGVDDEVPVMVAGKEMGRISVRELLP